MKKRTLKQQAKYVKKKILEEDKDFYNKVIEENYPKKNSRAKRLFAILAPSFAAVLTLVLLLIFLLPDGTTPIVPPDIPPKQYLMENEKSKDSDILELTQNLKGLNLEISNNDYIIISLTYDAEYEDTLFFTIDLTINDFEFATIYFYVNADYENQKDLKSENNTITINDFFIKYEKSAEEDDGLFTVKYKAKTEYSGITIFIEHTQLSLDEESNFFDFFEQTIKI